MKTRPSRRNCLGEVGELCEALVLGMKSKSYSFDEMLIHLLHFATLSPWLVLPISMHRGILVVIFEQNHLNASAELIHNDGKVSKLSEIIHKLASLPE